MKIMIVPALALALGGCEFLRGLNTEENREAGVQAAIAAIEALNADGFDPLKLNETEQALALTACRVLAGYLPTLTDDLEQRAELVALGMDVCTVLGVALAPAPVEAPEPVPAPEPAA